MLNHLLALLVFASSLAPQSQGAKFDHTAPIHCARNGTECHRGNKPHMEGKSKDYIEGVGRGYPQQ